MQQSTSTQPSTPAVNGTMRAQDGKGVVRMESRYATDREDLWQAVTDPERLARWLGDIEPEGELAVGARFGAHFRSSWEGQGRVDVCERPHHLLVTLSPGDDDESQVEAHLEADGDGTRLVVEERGLPLSNIAAYGAGWQAHVEDLGAHLQDETPRDWRERWLELRPVYDDAGLDEA